MQETTQSLNLKFFQGFEILPIFLGLEVGKYGKNTLVFPVDAEPETLSGTTRSLSTWRSQIMSAFIDVYDKQLW